MPNRTLTLLNADDDDANRYAVTRTLQKAGYIVQEATTGEAALLLARNLPALILLDVRLPDISGFEVCRRIKADPALASIPVLHLSASFVSSADRAQGLEGGADGYLIKPVEPVELLATVHSLLRMRLAEELAIVNAREWNTTFEAISDAVCLLDREGRIRRGNAVFSELLQMPLASLLGHSLAPCLPKFWAWKRCRACRIYSRAAGAKAWKWMWAGAVCASPPIPYPKRRADWRARYIF